MKKLIFYALYGYAMKIYHKDKDYEKARKFYEMAAQWNPDYAENLFKIGMCYKKERKYQEASEYFKKALELKPENIKYQEQLQIASNKCYSLFAPTKVWWQEIMDLESQIQKKGESFELLVKLAENCLAMKHYQKAANAYEKAIKLCQKKEKLAELYYEMGYAYENLADKTSLKSAEVCYQKAIELDEELESKRYGIGVFHFDKERWRFANRAFLEKLHSTTASLQGANTSPSSLRGQSPKQSIIQNLAFDNSTSIQNYRLPRDSNESLAMTQNQTRHCEAEPKQSIILQKVDSTMESLKQSEIIDLRSAGKFANANVRHENQRFSRNDAVVESRNDAKPNSSLRESETNEAIHNPAYFKDSIAESKINNIIDCHEANASRNDAVADTNTDDDLLLQKVGESFERVYDWENASKYYQESLNLNYQNPQTHFRLGFVYERMGNYAMAVESYSQGLKRNNDLNAYWVYRLGFCLNILGKFQEANQVFLNLQTTNALPLLVGGGGLQDDKFLE